MTKKFKYMLLGIMLLSNIVYSSHDLVRPHKQLMPLIEDKKDSLKTHPTTAVSNEKYLIPSNLYIKYKAEKSTINTGGEHISLQEIDALRKRWFGVDIGQKSDYSEIEKEYIYNKKIIKVCTNPNWTPIEFLEDNKPQGISIDTLEIVAKDINLALKYIKTASWSQSQEFLKQRKCDILPAAIKTKERAICQFHKTIPKI